MLSSISTGKWLIARQNEYGRTSSSAPPSSARFSPLAEWNARCPSRIARTLSRNRSIGTARPYTAIATYTYSFETTSSICADPLRTSRAGLNRSTVSPRFTNRIISSSSVSM